jgi:hypothetical protein
MTKEKIREQYRNLQIGYDFAINQLMLLGFTEYAADQYLFGEG